MSNTILIKRSGVANSVPTNLQLSLGELAINYQDGNLFYKDAGGTVRTLVSTQFVSVAGNVTGGNLNTGGLVSATGNVIGGNINTGGVVSATGNITGGNLSGTSIAGTLTTAAQTNITTVGTLNGVAVSGTALFDTIQGRTGSDLPIYGVGNANIIIGPAGTGRTDFYNKPIGNISTASVIGNVVGGNLITAGAVSAASVSASGTVTGASVVGGVITGTSVSVTGNITGGNLNATGLSLSGNVLSAINSTSNITTSANISAGYFLGNGALLTGISTSKIYNGTSEANIGTTDGNLAVSISGVSNVMVVNPTGVAVTGTVSASGNVTGGNLITAPGGDLVLGNANSIITQTGSNSTIGLDGSITLSPDIAANGLNGVIIGGNGYLLSGTGSRNAQLDYGASSGTLGIYAVNVYGNTATAITNGGANGVGNVGAPTGRFDTFYGKVIDASGNITGGNLITAGAISAASVSTSGNVTGGNVVTAGAVSAASVSSSGNVTGGNLVTAGAVSAASVSASGNITGNYLIGNLACASGIYTSKIFNGTSEANIGTSGGNANISIGGTSNVVVVTTGGIDITGTVSANGNVTGGNINTGGLVSAGGNVTGANINTSGLVSAGGNVTGANINTSGLVSAGGNVTGGNIITAGDVSAASASVSGNVTAGNIVTSGPSGNIFGANVISGVTLSASGNVIGGNVVTAGAVSAASVSASGNITGGNVNATNLSLSGNVVSALNASSSIAAGSTISAVGNITGGNLITAAAVSAASVSASGNVTAGNVNTNTLSGTGTVIKSTGDLNLSASGNITVGSTYINNLANPVQDQDAATKYYVDTVAQGLHIHAAANLATTQDLAAYTGATVTYNNGTGGVGATLSLVGNTLTTLDGTAIPASARLLIKNQANAVTNGIYNYTSSSLLTRSADANQDADLAGGDFIFVQSGATLADTGWVQVTDNVSIGNSNIVWDQFSGAGSYTANTAAGLVLIGSVFNAKVDNTTTAFDGGGNIVVKASAQLTTPNIGAATGSSLSVTGNVTSGNLNAAGLSLSSNVVSALNVTGNIAGGNITTPGIISSTGTITGGNIDAGSGTISTSGNITGGNVLFGSGIVSGTGNITGGNLNATGLSLSGNVVSVLNVTGNVNGGNINGVNGVYSGGASVLTVNDTVDGGTY